MAAERLTVFVVDDDEAVRDSLRLLLEADGRLVRDFAGGPELLAGLPDAPAGCLVLDYQMPVIDGLDLLDRLRARKVSLPVIFITGLCDARLRRRARGSGVQAILEKPFS